MRHIQTLFLIILIAGCSNSQPVQKQITGELIDDLKVLLPEGKVNVDIIDGIKMNPKYEELNSKFMTGVQNNYDWFLEQQKIVEQTGNPMPYHPNLGMTESEFEEYKTFMENGTGVEMVKNGSAQINFKYQDNFINLSGNGRLDLLNDVRIDLTNNIVWIGDYKLDKFEKVNVDSDNNGLKSKWSGYQWRYDYSNKPEFNSLSSTEDLQNLNMKIYKLTVALLDKDKTTYIEITEKEIENGTRTKTFQIPFKF
jgi:hypothetical protein